jgi:hypothetical protein
MAILLQEDEDLPSVYGHLKKHYVGYQVDSWKDLSPETELMVTAVNQYS